MLDDKTILIAENIIKRYDHGIVLDNVSLILQANEKIGLMAGSGVGKTTLIHILAGLDDNFAGKVHCFATKRGIVFQERALFSHKTVKENIFYVVEASEYNLLRYSTWLEVTGLNGYENAYPHQLSRGMCQKVAIIRAFLDAPDVVFLDEPVSALDKESKKKIFTFLAQEYQETALIMASHSRWELEVVCDRIIHLGA